MALLVLLVLSLGGFWRDSRAVTNAPAISPRALILYDSEGDSGWVGQLHAQMLANLLGHFPVGPQIRPVESYQAGDMGSFQTVFYIGTEYDNPLPTGFLQDVISATNSICWFQYNLWQLSWSSSFGPPFRRKFGFRFDYLDSSGYSNITYKGETLLKDMSQPDLGRVTILNNSIATVAANAYKDSPSNSIPYAVHGSNLWYFADSPFSYIHEEDRYLVFADLLHDVLGINHPEQHRALIRLEDVSPTYATNQLGRAADCLRSEGVPFAVAVIPVYVDPLHAYGSRERLAMPDAPKFVDALRYLTNQGGQLLMHGYTHQYGSTLNPYSGVSGDDFEFFRETLDDQEQIVDYQPVPEDSRAWVSSRLTNGIQEFARAGFKPVAWETPHYAASALDYSVFAETFPLTMQRVIYFSTEGYTAGQFFPYVIEKDVYGQKIMPENLGNVSPPSAGGAVTRMPADLIRAARKNRVIRDGWASAFYHPYLGTNYLKELVRGIKDLGYTYVPLAVAPVSLQPRLNSNGGLVLSFPTQVGVSYDLESTTNVTQSSWRPVQTVSGTGGRLEVIEPSPGSRSFYRIVTR